MVGKSLFVIIYSVISVAGIFMFSFLPAYAVEVNSLDDIQNPPAGVVTLRKALADAGDGETIVFDPALNGGTIELSIVGQAHTVLKGEVMVFEDGISKLKGYFNRDYGSSALYAQKNVIIDASALESGITLAWMGGEVNPARVLAVYGNLTMSNVNVTGGRSVAQASIPVSGGYHEQEAGYDQIWSLGRGGGVAVWGTAHLTGCGLFKNYCEGDTEESRDRGAFGGGLYANVVNLNDCTVSSNRIQGAGAAGGGVYSVGGIESNNIRSTIDGSSVTDNHISAIFTYGGGVYTDGGGIGRRNRLIITNSTIAKNLVDVYVPADMPAFLIGNLGYWRGGGVYMSNGYLEIQSCTIVENQVHGPARTDELDKPNLAGGIAATIGNAHAVEDLQIGHSIVTGNTVHPWDGAVYDQDVFTGSIFYFRSMGYNLIGTIDFSQILVPVGQETWRSLSRKHYPKEGDEVGVKLEDVLVLDNGSPLSEEMWFAGMNSTAPAAVHYHPKGKALDKISVTPYQVRDVRAQYRFDENVDDADFLKIFLNRVESWYELDGLFAQNFIYDFEQFLADVDPDEPGAQYYMDASVPPEPILSIERTLWYGPVDTSGTWPSQIYNRAWITFWHRFDQALSQENIADMGPELIGDDAWFSMFQSGPLDENTGIYMEVWEYPHTVRMPDVDQLGQARPLNAKGDIGAVEVFTPPCPGDIFPDNVVDGKDLAELAAGGYGPGTLSDVANDFGRTHCPD